VLRLAIDIKLFDAAATLVAKGVEIQDESLASEIDADPAFIGKCEPHSTKNKKLLRFQLESCDFSSQWTFSTALRLEHTHQHHFPALM
jgi:hypothetical protein